MKRSQFLRRGAAAGVALTVGAKSLDALAAENKPVTVEWTRPIVQVFDDGRPPRVIWWPGKEKSDAAMLAEDGSPR